jgi:phosphonate transport system substrate-binding protein
LEFKPILSGNRRSRRRFLLFGLAVTGVGTPAVRAAEEPLIMGVFPRRNASETLRMFAPLAGYLGKQLEREVRLVSAKNFDAFWKDVTDQRYDIVHYNQYHYIRSAKFYKVIAHTQEFGRNSVASALYVRKDSGITAVSQLRGRTVIFGGNKDAMLSYIAPRYLLLQAGLKEGDFATRFAVNPLNALVALYHKQADAAGGGDVVIDQPVIRNAINTEEIRILAATEPLLFLPWAVKRAMSARLAQSIQSTLLELKHGETGKGVLKSAIMTAMEKAEDRDYDPHRRIVAAVFGAEGIAK